MAPNTVTTKTRQFTDLDLSLKKHPVTGDIAIKTGDNAVISAVRNLIMTNFYERPNHPEKGSGVPRMIFELITPLTAQQVKREIEDVITNFEPRVQLTNVAVTAFPGENYLQARIEFYIVNNVTPTTINIFLERTR